MVASHQFYCLFCERLKEIKQSAVVFKTGFYRTRHPLGCCRECQERSSRRPEDSREIPLSDTVSPSK
ncbi:hypothetical protein [Cohnella fermenti]|uniref:Uncharacterized protein n=1 Tax=Cohnella fermenti TaxID=2565925 RepID=A0A4S4BJ85_9BACL|nr:hypothetical protein [Cohnella fermenti]THF74712.1 hypothetical protein E6C55_24175 [Cohnella fermenti]